MSLLFERLASFRGGYDDPRLPEVLWEEFGCERTVLVLDMAGFTATSKAKGVVFYLTLIENMRYLTRPLVQREGGQVVKYEADNLFAVFHDPAAAMRFLEAAYEETAKLNEGRERPAQLHICAGLDHGQILLDEADYFGDAVNLASKLGEDLARSGEVLVSKTVHEMLEGVDYEFEDVGSHGFYGTPHPVFRWRRGQEE